MKTIVIKIGGSVILDKKGNLRKSLIKELFEIFSILKARKLLVLGCGSHLHQLTYRYNLTDKPKMGNKRIVGMNKRIEGFFELYKLVEKNLLAVVSLIPPRFNKPEVIHPAQLFLKNSKDSAKAHEIVWFNRKLVDRNQYLLTSGGIVLDENILISAISSDTIAAYLAIACKAERMLLLSDVDGVYTYFPGGGLLKKVTLGAVQNYKIKGGMRDKLRRIKPAINEKIPTLIINGNDSQRVREVLLREETEIGSEILK